MKQELLKRGVSALHPAPFAPPPDCTFEPPCSIKWMGIDYCLTMGAFSYAVSGYYFGADIARYVSIGESVQVGRGSHPVQCGSTSPLFYTPHSAFFDRVVPRAEDYEICGPYLWPQARAHRQRRLYRARSLPDARYHDRGRGSRRRHGGGDQGRATLCDRSRQPGSGREDALPDKLIERYLKVQWWRYAFWDLRQCSITDRRSSSMPWRGADRRGDRGVQAETISYRLLLRASIRPRRVDPAVAAHRCRVSQDTSAAPPSAAPWIGKRWCRVGRCPARAARRLPGWRRLGGFGQDRTQQ